MKIAFIDCSSGISGDMILGALIDSGVPVDRIKSELKKLKGIKFELKTARVSRQHVSGLKVNVVSKESHSERNLKDIRNLISQSRLAECVKENGIKIFESIAEVEAKIHSAGKEDVHFHEIGGVDSIVDIVGTCVGFEMLKPDRIVCSPVNTGSGKIRCSHGVFPIPAPATAELLKGIPAYSDGTQAELTTPTGAGIIKELADEFSELPKMSIEKIGYGAGSRELDFPNILRVFTGQKEGTFEHDTMNLIETNIDDMDSRIFGHVVENLMSGGAKDAFLTPIIMKKGRPAVKLSALVDDGNLDRVLEYIYENTTTLGARISRVFRSKLTRKKEKVATEWGKVGVVIGMLEGKIMNVSPEYEECRIISERSNAPLKRILDSVKSVAQKKFMGKR